MTSVRGGHTPVGFLALSPAAKQIADGRLRALAVTGRTRSKLFPDVPTMIEQGHPEIVGDLWVGVLAPAKTAPDVVARLNKEIVVGLQMPEVREKLAAIGFEAIGSSPEAFAALIASESAAWGKVVRDAKIEPAQ